MKKKRTTLTYEPGDEIWLMIDELRMRLGGVDQSEVHRIAIKRLHSEKQEIVVRPQLAPPENIQGLIKILNDYVSILRDVVRKKIPVNIPGDTEARRAMVTKLELTAQKHLPQLEERLSSLLAVTYILAHLDGIKAAEIQETGIMFHDHVTAVAAAAVGKAGHSPHERATALRWWRLLCLLYQSGLFWCQEFDPKNPPLGLVVDQQKR